MFTERISSKQLGDDDLNKDLTLRQPNESWLDEFWKRLVQHQITQKQLAAEIGINRSYLNQLLNGKRNLTDDMRQRLMFAYCELAGTDPLNICLDYVRIRFPTHDIFSVITKLFRIKSIYFVYDAYGRYGYTGKYWHGEMEIFISPDNDNRGTLVELKGRGCRELEGILLVQKRSWYDFFRTALSLDGVVKRIDLAINDFMDVIPVHYFIEKSIRHEYVTKFKECKYFVRDKNDLKGESLYFGSRRSNIYFCLYQKDIEQYFKFNINPEQTKIKNRFELRLANERAETVIKELLIMRQPNKIVFGIINNYLKFITPTSGLSKSDWPIDNRWRRFIGNYTGKVKLTMVPEPISLERTIKWIEKQVAPTLKMLLTLDSAKSEDNLMKMIVDAKLSDQQLALIKQMLADPEEMVIK